MTSPRAIAVAVAITAPLSALAALAVQRFVPRSRSRVALVADYGIRNVPDRPPLWRTPTAAPATGPVPLRAVDPLPDHDPHAPATPPFGTPRVR
jgi:hypothetical protein